MNTRKLYFVTAIGTDSGKTLVSSILCEAMGADYWKPVQCGEPRDSDVVVSLVSNEKLIVHPETYFLSMPASPHAASQAEGVEIKLEDFKLPPSENSLVIEGAGGVLVPLNEKDFVIDLIKHLDVKVILVANLYLGSINHTLLTLEGLKNRNIKIEGIIFNGEPNSESERIILQKSKLKVLLRIHPEDEITKDVVVRYALILKQHLSSQA